MRLFSILLITLLSLNLSACARYVKKVDYKPGREVAEDAAPVPILFREVEMLLPVGMDVGFESEGGRFCGWPRYPVSRTVLRDAIDKKFIKQTFHDVLEAQGYDVVGSLDIAYDLEDELDRAEYSIKAKVKDVQLEMCHQEPDNFMIFFTTRRGTEGEFYMNVDWAVYDALRRTVVYKTSTEGYTKRRIPNQEGLTLMLTDAFEMAAHNLGADEDFHNLLVNGTKPQGWKTQSPRKDKQESRAPQFDPQEQVRLPAAKLSKTPFSQNTKDKARVFVMVQKFGHGSGFFISKQGHILTNAHAVGDGLRTRIVTAGKEEKLVAEVLRVDKARDVALLKLETVPEGMDIQTLPLRTDWPDIGEDVYTIGVPKDYRKFIDSLSKGIISAHRKDMKFGGVRQNYIQADIDVHKGSDGGPLIDEYGNIIGMTVGGIRDESGTGMGLNFFIPIGEALQALDIEM